MKLNFACLCVLLTFSVMADNKVIYGSDNRTEVRDYRNRSIVALSRSTVALVKAENLTPSGVQLILSGDNYGDKYNLCRKERFTKQLSASFCSGFLIAENKIVTAGHCVRTERDCSALRFVFDYKMTSSTRAQTSFATEQVYSCKKVLGWKEEDAGADYAIVELDRAVTNRKPLKLADNTKLKVGSGILVIGHPSGLPTKITDGASVRRINTGDGFFVANLDTYGGNSGSAVFNTRTLEVEGILVRGEEDFESHESQECVRSYRIRNNQGRGEDVTLMSVVKENDGLVLTPAAVTSYVWLEADSTCNEFSGAEFVGEVIDSLCPGH